MRMLETARPRRSPAARGPGSRPACFHRQPWPQATKPGAGTTVRARPPWTGALSWELNRLRTVRRNLSRRVPRHGGAACRSALAAPRHVAIAS
jgi:hypothetical protein